MSLKKAIVRTRENIPEVDVKWVSEHFHDARVVDCREADELVGPLSCIEGVEHVPTGEILEAAESWDKGEDIVILCRSGGRSGQVAIALEQRGFETVASMAGGMIDWNNHGLPTRD